MINGKPTEYKLLNGKVVESTVKEIGITGVKLNKTSMTLAYGKSETLKTTVTPSNASNNKLVWKSSNPQVVKVDNGKITAVKRDINPVTITVSTSDGKYSAKCKVIVPVRILFIGNSKTYVRLYRQYVTAIASNINGIVFEGKTTSDNSYTNYLYVTNTIGTKAGANAYYSFTKGSSNFWQKYQALTYDAQKVKNGSYLNDNGIDNTVKKTISLLVECLGSSNNYGKVLSEFKNLDVDIVVMQEGADGIRDLNLFKQGAKSILDLLVYDNNGKVKNKDLKIFIRDMWGATTDKKGGLVPSTSITEEAVQYLNNRYKSLNNKIQIIYDGAAINELHNYYEVQNKKSGTILGDERHQNYLGAYAAALIANYKIFGIEPKNAINQYVPSQLEKNTNDNGERLSSFVKDKYFLSTLNKYTK